MADYTINKKGSEIEKILESASTALSEASGGTVLLYADKVNLSGTGGYQPINTVIGGIKSDISGKQATLVSGTNIKTINNQSILGSGNITIQGGGGGGASTAGGVSYDSARDTQTGSVGAKLTELASKVGDDTSGLVKAVADLQTEVSGVETELYNING